MVVISSPLAAIAAMNPKKAGSLPILFIHKVSAALFGFAGTSMFRIAEVVLLTV
jgi:hypothetical protein